MDVCRVESCVAFSMHLDIHVATTTGRYSCGTACLPARPAGKSHTASGRFSHGNGNEGSDLSVPLRLQQQQDPNES